MLTLFLIAAVILLATPGPAVLYIVARSIDQGRTAGLVSTLGIGTGTLVHVAAAALGISALLVTSALAFDVVRYLGAAYLVFLGVRRLADRGAVEAPREASGRRSLRRIYSEGVVVNVLNPKTALFLFAFLPQFVDPSRGSAAAQVLLLGGLFVALGILSDGLWALLAGTLGGWLKGNLRYVRAQRYVAGGTFIALGLATALAGRARK
jgi:threonine/homoserine/homoserine lactone efflux protein